LLKTLEEPPAHALLVLTTGDEDALPATIRSRCQVIALRPVPAARIARWLQEEQGLGAGQARTLAALCGGRPGWARAAAADPQLLAAHDALVERVGGLLDLDAAARVAAVPRFLDRSSFNENRQAAAELLDLLLRWTRDLLVIAEGLPDLVVYSRHFERLESQATRLSREGALRAVHLIRQAADDVEHNLTPRLVIETLLLRLPPARLAQLRPTAGGRR
jgi:DNA polymerase-3 subunit delta'